MTTITLPGPLKRTAEETAAAHQQVTEAIEKQKKATQRRNLAVFVLYHVHEQKKVAPLSRLAAINRVDFYKLLKKSPIPSKLKAASEKLHATSVEAAKAVVAKQVEKIGDLAVEEEEARERRIRGVLKLSQARIDGEPLTNADIAKVTNLSATLVGTDLDEAKARGYAAEADQAEADDATPDESAGMIPLTTMAERLGVTVERLLARVAAVRKAGGTVEGMSRVGSRVMMADPVAFPAWWERLHLGWVTLSEFADSRGVRLQAVRDRLRTARRHGLELAQSDEYGGFDLYEPQQLGEWWEQYTARSEAVSRGHDDAGRRNVSGMAVLLGLTYDQAKERIRTWQERGDELPPHVVDDKGTRWFEPVEFAAKARGVEHLLDELVSAMAPARAVRPLKEQGVETVRDLLHLGEEQLGKVAGLGPKSVQEIRHRVREAGLIFK